MRVPSLRSIVRSHDTRIGVLGLGRAQVLWGTRTGAMYLGAWTTLSKAVGGGGAANQGGRAKTTNCNQRPTTLEGDTQNCQRRGNATSANRDAKTKRRADQVAAVGMVRPDAVACLREAGRHQGLRQPSPCVYTPSAARPLLQKTAARDRRHHLQAAPCQLSGFCRLGVGASQRLEVNPIWPTGRMLPNSADPATAPPSPSPGVGRRSTRSEVAGPPLRGGATWPLQRRFPAPGRKSASASSTGSGHATTWANPKEPCVPE